MRLFMLPLLIASCRVEPPELDRPGDHLSAPIVATAPPAPGPEGEVLYQQLYAGEFGQQAGQIGQRARILAWFRYVGFTSDQLGSLASLAADVWRMRDDDLAYIAEVDAREAEALSPVYTEIVALYASGQSVTDDELAPLSLKLEQARLAAYPIGDDPRAKHYTHVRLALSRVTRWLGSIPADQVVKLAACRFFLQRQLGPFVAPGDYSKWLGTAWNGSDFASLRTGVRPENEGQMDLGGLWSYEPLASDDATRITDLRASVLMLLAIESDGFEGALLVARGQIAADDYGVMPE